MTRNIYNIGNQSFTSKNNINNQTRQLINEVGIGGKIFPNDERFNYLNDLLQYHEDYENKIGCGIKYFFITNHLFNNPQLNIHRIDGTNIDIAYIFGSKFNCKNKHNTNLTSAMRDAIKDFTIDYKTQRARNNNNTGTLCCDKCLINNLNYKDYQTDHIHPFCEIKKEFLKNNTIEIPVHFTDNENAMKVFENKDAEFKTSWINFHNSFENNYQLLCQSCNGRKGGRIIN